MIGNSNDETKFPHKLLTDQQLVNLHKAFANNSPVNTNLSKTQLSKTIQLGGFLGRLHCPLLKTGFPLMKNVIKLLTKKIFNSIRINCMLQEYIKTS